MVTTFDIAESIGRVRLAEALGVGVTAVSNAVVAGKFPAAWYVCVNELCSKVEQECPPRLFGMKGLVT